MSWTFRVTTEEALEPTDAELDDLRKALATDPAIGRLVSVEVVGNDAIEVVVEIEAPDPLNGASRAFGALANALQDTTIWVRTTYVKGTSIEKAKFGAIELLSAREG